MVEIETSPGLLWTAVYTRPRTEKVVADYCARHDIQSYLPLRRRAERYQRRTVETFLPMFPGYVFVQLGDASKVVLLQSHKIVHVLQVTVAKEPTLITELRDLQLLEQAGLQGELMVHPELAPGTPVLICAGPLKGLTGVVERRQQKLRVTVNVELLGQSVSVDLDVGEVEVAEE